jgi:hypothetical protein
MWSFFAYTCDVRMCLWCLLAVVLPYSGWFQDATPDGCQILASSRMQPASGQITIGVAYVCVTGVNKLITNTDQWVTGFIRKARYKHANNVPILTRGPQDLARSLRYRRQKLKACKADAHRNKCVSFHRDRADTGLRNASLMLISQ